MNWLSLAGVFESVLKTVFGSRERRDDAAASENAVAMQQYAAEFVSREARSWFDVAVDGINRLQRPTYTFSTLALFWLAYKQPAEFARIMEGFALIPEPFWVVTGMIVGFLFSSRMIEKLPVSRAFQGITEEHLARIREAGENPPPPQVENPSIAAWKKQLHKSTGHL